MQKSNITVLFAAFQRHLQTNLAFLNGKKLLLAVSGGLDSMVLAGLFKQNDNDIALAHCNFKLRGNEADADEEFVKDYGIKNGIPVFTKSFNTETYAGKHGISIQMAARELRYRWFEEVRKKHGFHFILTAHHADDQIETLLINLIRGTGLEGLTGIPEHHKNIVRPLLPFNRTELKQYALENNIKWREDRSNAETKYMRNKIRHQLLPLIASINPNYRDGFKQTIANLQGSASIVKKHVKKLNCAYFKRAGAGTWHIDIKKLKHEKPLKPLLFEMLKDFGFTEWDDVYHLLNAQTGKQLISKTHRLVKDRDKWILSKLKTGKPVFTEISIPENLREIEFPEGKLLFQSLEKTESLPELSDSSDTILIDYSKLQYPLSVRKWQKGDCFYPFGMEGKKKLSKYFKDEKLSRPDKENIYLLCSRNKIVWVIGMRLDKRFKLEENTRKIIQVKYKKE